MILLGLLFQGACSKMDMGRVEEFSGEAESIIQRHNLQDIALTSVSLPERGNSNSSYNWVSNFSACQILFLLI